MGCVKRCLKKVLGNAPGLTYDEILIVLTEVEAMIMIMI